MPNQPFDSYIGFSMSTEFRPVLGNEIVVVQAALVDQLGYDEGSNSLKERIIATSWTPIREPVIPAHLGC